MSSIVFIVFQLLSSKIAQDSLQADDWSVKYYGANNAGSGDWYPDVQKYGGSNPHVSTNTLM